MNPTIPAFSPDCYIQGSASYAQAIPARFLAETKTTIKVETESGKIRTFQKPKEFNGSYPSIEAIREKHEADRWRYYSLFERGNSDSYHPTRLYFDLDAQLNRDAESAKQRDRDSKARKIAEQIQALIYPAMKDRYYHPDDAEISRLSDALAILKPTAE